MCRIEIYCKHNNLEVSYSKYNSMKKTRAFYPTGGFSFERILWMYDQPAQQYAHGNLDIDGMAQFSAMRSEWEAKGFIVFQ